jgi:ABC-type antimicrobial peptide transport system permease subunit
MLQLMGTLAVLAFVLAAAGIYGVLSFFTAQRTREVGVRMAMGATPRDILGMVMREGLSLVAAGAVAGLAGTLAATRLLSALLFGVSPTDPLTIAATTMALSGVALVACYVPARRATRIDPIQALKSD